MRDPRLGAVDPALLPWSELEPDGKRERLLDVATEVFTEQGLDDPMPRIAAAAGIGIGSLYRSYRSKEDLVAALLVRQLGFLRDEVSAAGGPRSRSQVLIAGSLVLSILAALAIPKPGRGGRVPTPAGALATESG